MHLVDVGIAIEELDMPRLECVSVELLVVSISLLKPTQECYSQSDNCSYCTRSNGRLSELIECESARFR